MKFESNVRKVVTGKYQTGVITNEGTYVCGRNDYGCLGSGTGEEILVPEMIELEHSDRIVDVVFGDKFQTFVITERRRVYAMGNNSGFQLGIGKGNSTEP